MRRRKLKSPNKHVRSKSNNREKFPNKPYVTCWSCGEKEHFWTDCRKLKKKQNHKSRDDDFSIYLVVDTKDALILSVDNLTESWIFDSGASCQSSPCKELFRNFKLENFRKVYLADNKLQ